MEITKQKLLKTSEILFEMSKPVNGLNAQGQTKAYDLYVAFKALSGCRK